MMTTTRIPKLQEEILRGYVLHARPDGKPRVAYLSVPVELDRADINTIKSWVECMVHSMSIEGGSTASFTLNRRVVQVELMFGTTRAVRVTITHWPALSKKR